MSISLHIPKIARFTIGAKTAYFSEKSKKAAILSECIFTVDILKFLVSTAWEGKFISNKHYENIAAKLDEVGNV